MNGARIQIARQVYWLAVALVGTVTFTGVISARDDSPAPESLSRKIDTEARRVLSNMKTSVYAHKSHVDEQQGLYELDCSGLVDLILKNVSPKHLAEVETRRGHKRQLADDYAQTFEESSENPKSGGGWQRIEHPADARPGDILAWKNPAHKTGEHTNTGHVMIIDESPIEERQTAATSADGSKAYRVRVIDSTESPHADDTRTAGQSGVGRGTLWLVVDAAGKPIGYHWKSLRGPLHQAPVTIGRAVSGKFEPAVLFKPPCPSLAVSRVAYNAVALRTMFFAMECLRMTACALTINGGSSSIKFAVYALGDPPTRTLSGEIERIGLSDAALSTKAPGQTATRQPIDAADHSRAVEHLIAWLERRIGLKSVAAIGHRIVHGGPNLWQSQRVTPELVAELKRISPWDPNHLPAEISLIEAFGRQCPDLPQVACFDTDFHHDLPRVARMLPVPRRLEAEGVRRYGFHGLSFTYLMRELARIAGPAAAAGRIILAHLGAGASLAAVHGGRCIDTSMAFTPTAGLVMATRTGDLDPGLLVYLMRSQQMTAEQIDDLVNKKSGLLGISETSPDMRDLLARQAGDMRAAEAVAMFCYQAKKWIGAFVAALGGLDTLVFSGGIGENAAEVRRRICESLDCFGVRLDAARNDAHSAVISTEDSRATVRVIRTDEESVLVAEVCNVVDTLASAEFIEARAP